MLAFALAVLVAADPPGLVARIGTPAFRQCGHVVGISTDGRRLYSVGASWPLALRDRGPFTVTDADTGGRLRTYPTLGVGETAPAFELARGELRVLVLDPHTEQLRLRVVDPDTGLVVRQSKPWDAPKGEGNGWGHGLELFGGRYATFRDGKSLRLLDPESGKLTAFDPPLSHEERVADTSPDGRVCVVNLKDGGVRLYDLPSGKRRTDFPKIGKSRSAFGFTPDGRAVAVWVGDEEGAALELRDFDGQFVRLLLENQGGGAGPWVVFDPTGKTFACRNSNRDFAEDVCEIRDLATGRRIARIPDRTQGDASYVYSPDGKTLWDFGSIPVPFDAATGKLRANAPSPPGQVVPFQFRADGELVGVVGENVFMWDPRTGRQTSHYPKPPSLNWHHGCSFDAAGERLLCHSPRSGDWLWDFREIPRRPPVTERELETPDGEGWMHNEWLHLKREKGELLLRVLPGDKPDGRPRPGEWRVPDKNESLHAILPPGGKSMVVGEFSGPRGSFEAEVTFAMIDLTAPKSAPVAGTTERGMWGFASPSFSSDGRWMVFVNGGNLHDQREHVLVFDLKSRKLAARIDLPTKHASDGEFSPDGRMFAVGGYLETVLIETATWKVRAMIRPPKDMGGGSGTVRWSPRGRLFATATADGRVATWDVARCAPPFAGTLNDAWDALARPDAAAAFSAMRHLAEHPDAALKMIRSKPAPRGIRAARAVEAVEWMRVWDAYRVLEEWAVSFWYPDLAGEAWFAYLRVQKPL